MKTTTHSPRRALHRITVGMWMLLTICLLVKPSVHGDTLFVSNYLNDTISRITEDGAVTTFASVAPKPFGVAFDSRGNLYAASAQLTNRISRISSNGTVTTFSPLLRSFDATALAFDSRGRLYVGSQNGYGVGRIGAAGAAGNLYVANFGLGRISRIAPDGTASTFATGFSGPSGIAFDTAGNLYVANQGANTVSKVTPDGTVSSFARGLSRPLYIAVQPDPAPPSLLIPQQSPDEISQSGLGITLRGAINTYYQVLHSEDLVTWTPFQTNQVIASSEVQIVDPEATFATQRFYRARRLP